MTPSRISPGELESLKATALAVGDMVLHDQAHTEQFFAAGEAVHPQNWRVQRAALQRQHMYHCPCCRRWRNAFSDAERRLMQERGFCHDCQRTDFARLRCHITFLQDAITAPTATDGWQDRIRCKALALPESERDVYRRLYRKRQAQCKAAQALLVGRASRARPLLLRTRSGAESGETP